MGEFGFGYYMFYVYFCNVSKAVNIVSVSAVQGGMYHLATKLVQMPSLKCNR